MFVDLPVQICSYVLILGHLRLYELKKKNELLSVYLRCSVNIPHLDFENKVILSLDFLLTYLVECKNSDDRISCAIAKLTFIFLCQIASLINVDLQFIHVSYGFLCFGQ